jgi:hypothetical protein
MGFRVSGRVLVVLEAVYYSSMGASRLGGQIERLHCNLPSSRTRSSHVHWARDRRCQEHRGSTPSVHSIPSIHDSFAHKYHFSSYSSPSLFCPACSNPLRINWFLQLPSHIQLSRSVLSMLSVLLSPWFSNVTHSLTFMSLPPLDCKRLPLRGGASRRHR